MPREEATQREPEREMERVLKERSQELLGSSLE